MNILLNNKPIINYNQPYPQKTIFRGKLGVENLPNDIFESADSLIKTANENNHKNKFVVFKEPLLLSDAIRTLALSKNPIIQKTLFLNDYSPEKISSFLLDITGEPKLENQKVTNVLGLGSFAIAFQMPDGNTLKLSERNHFPNNRKPDSFDLPIFDKGKIGKLYYYFEETANQNYITEKEIYELLDTIQAKGYKITDYLKRNPINNDQTVLKKEQFGRGYDGKLYLIDPGCAYKTPKIYDIIDKIKNVTNKIARLFHK